MSFLKVTSITVLTCLLLGSLGGATQIRSHPPTSQSRSLSNKSIITQIRTQVSSITKNATHLRKVKLWDEPDMAFHHGGATAYYEGNQLRKVVNIGPCCSVAGKDVREWYFVNNHPVFMLETVSWYQTNKNRISPTLRNDHYIYRYYFHQDHLLTTVSNHQREEGDEQMDAAQLQAEWQRIQKALILHEK